MLKTLRDKHLRNQSGGTVIFTVLDEDLRACEASMNGCHVQGALPFFALIKKE